MITDDVLFVDAEALVINKPAGLAVHPGPKTPHSLEDLADDLRFGFVRPPAAVHRLDRDTSGCLLMARNPRAHRRLSAMFEQALVSKTYWAVLDGVPDTKEGQIDLPLGRVSSAAEGWRIVVDHQKGKAACTRWQLLDVQHGRALVAFYPKTGRTHQLRVHAASGLGLPIMGDPVYGTSATNSLAVHARDGRNRASMLLHARRLIVPRGDNRVTIDISAPLPDRFLQAGFSEGVFSGD